VEITDVRILSASLFKDLQCEFREDQNRKATIQKMDVTHELNVKKEDDRFTTNKRDQDTYEKKAIVDSQRNILKKKQELDRTKKNNEITLSQKKISEDQRFKATQRSNKL
jgi:hypothetical protein